MQPMAAPCPLLGDGITDDTLLNIARFLPAARDLLCLRLTNSRFAAKVIAAAPRCIVEGVAAVAPEMLCIADEAARLWLVGCSEQERGWVPRYHLDRWLCLMQEVGLLRVPLVFGRAHGSLTLHEGGAVATKDGAGGGWRSAASMVVMWSGRHFVHFTVLGGFARFGVTRPGWGVEGGDHDEDGHCFYSTGTGSRYPGANNWGGRQDTKEPGDRIGILFDLVQGSMTVWKNDLRLGVMQAEGLSGPPCWAVSLFEQGAPRVTDGGGAGGGGGVAGSSIVTKARAERTSRRMSGVKVARARLRRDLGWAEPAVDGDRCRVRGCGSRRGRAC